MIDIARIPDVSASEATRLAELNLHTSTDLLRSSRSALVRAMPALTLARVRRWQAFAELALIEGVTEAEAAMMLTAGADGAGEVGRWTMARARAALPHASEEALLGWIRDAVHLSLSGVVNGNIRLKDGTPIEGAEVKIDGQTHVSDARGRFRATRLALDRKVVVTIHHATLGYKLVRGVAVTRPTALVGRIFILAGRPQQAKSLSQLRGDRLPPLDTAPFTTKSMRGAPDPGDILMVIDRYSGGDARAASRFIDFTEGRFVRRTYRIAMANLPAGLQDGDDIEWTGTLWALARYSAREIALRSRMTAVRAMAAKGAMTPEKHDRVIKAALKALADG